MTQPTEPGAVEYAEATVVPTAVVKASQHPLNEIGQLFDATFGALFPALGERGIAPVGVPFSLHTRIPDETADLEVGVAVDRPFGEPVPVGEFQVEASELPGGTVARTSYVGPYDGLGDAWGDFMAQIAADGRTPLLPFWELYVTEPSPETDPTTLRTDLVMMVDAG